MFLYLRAIIYFRKKDKGGEFEIKFEILLNQQLGSHIKMLNNATKLPIHEDK